MRLPVGLLAVQQAATAAAEQTRATRQVEPWCCAPAWPTFWPPAGPPHRSSMPTRPCLSRHHSAKVAGGLIQSRCGDQCRAAPSSRNSAPLLPVCSGAPGGPTRLRIEQLPGAVGAAATVKSALLVSASPKAPHAFCRESTVAEAVNRSARLLPDSSC